MVPLLHRLARILRGAVDSSMSASGTFSRGLHPRRAAWSTPLSAPSPYLKSQDPERATPDWQEWLISTAELSSAWGAHLPLQFKPFVHHPAQHFLPTDLQPRRLERVCHRHSRGTSLSWVTTVTCVFASCPLGFHTIF